ncbi:ABC1 kinase family protein [Heyndrickxia acidicola]|uniref:AarF/UbiB family protein n=1 Tax=Heyndrickxia acidicola TaxID=209389 RepID=A0ABU6MAW1_9BACI|nr:AarF/UbiB family protein [Heyndrickxia acidicola]MED1201766.1 AarF/UbiB family protein [Heyndrickxia acidicola]
MGINKWKQNKWYRITSVVGMTLGFFLKIYWFQLRKKSEGEWKDLWRKFAITFKKKAYSLEGLLIKVGQLLSVREDLLPDVFIEEMKELVDQVPPSSWQDISNVLEAEWGVPIQEKLSFIDKEPVASASIGQVFKGELMDGTIAAIKVQRPEISSIMKADFQALAIIMWCANRFSSYARKMVDFPLLYKELRHVIERELDFLEEMNTAVYFRKRYKQNPDIYIPKMYSEHCTKRILVMEWIDAERVTDPPVQLKRKDVAKSLLSIFMPQWLEGGKFHADPHEGNVLINQKGQIVLLDFGMVGEISNRDSEIFRKLIEGAVFKDYKKMVKNLSRLGFLLSSADSDEMERTLEELLEVGWTSGAKSDILSFQKEINELVRSLPIQVPIRFVFFGRSAAIIEGLLQTLCPNIDLMEMAKPVFFDWMKNTGQARWRFIAEWLFSASIFQAVKNLPDLLEEPKRKREWEEEKQKNEFILHQKKTNKQFAFLFTVLNIITTYAAAFLQKYWMIEFTLPLAGAGFIWFFTALLLERKWMEETFKSK